MFCEELPVIKNGQLQLIDRRPPFSFPVNDFVPYTCDENYRTDDLNPKVTCVLRDNNVANWTEGVCKRKIFYFEYLIYKTINSSCK